MSINIVQGSSHKPLASKELIKMMLRQTDWSGHLFIGYPIIGTYEGAHRIDALLIIPDKGIVILDLIEGTDISSYESRQDDSANRLEAQLKTHRELMQRRDLLINIHAISFAPEISNSNIIFENYYPLVNTSSLIRKLEDFTWKEPKEEIYKKALSVIQNISTIRKNRTRRNIERENSRGNKLKRLEESIATLDNKQSKAVIETVEGVQRIRGLAGSGKTIVLALKAAYLHAQHPQWRIGITFNTRSLKGLFRRLIERFTFDQTGEEPNWENLRIINAWGAPGNNDRDGIYHQFCRFHDIEYFNFLAAREKFGRGNEFPGACEYALRQVHESNQFYEVLLVDEAQDFFSNISATLL